MEAGARHPSESVPLLTYLHFPSTTYPRPRSFITQIGASSGPWPSTGSSPTSSARTTRPPPPGSPRPTVSVVHECLFLCMCPCVCVRADVKSAWARHPPTDVHITTPPNECPHTSTYVHRGRRTRLLLLLAARLLLLDPPGGGRRAQLHRGGCVAAIQTLGMVACGCTCTCTLCVPTLQSRRSVRAPTTPNTYHLHNIASDSHTQAWWAPGGSSRRPTTRASSPVKTNASQFGCIHAHASVWLLAD